MKNFLINLLFIPLLLTACLAKPEPVATASPTFEPQVPTSPPPVVNVLESGDIVVTNLGNDSIVLLDENGVYKRTLYDVPTDASISFPAVFFDEYSNKLLFSYDSTVGTLDAIYGIDPVNGAVAQYFSNSNLSGTLPSFTRLANDDLVFIEGTNAIEKYLSNFNRVGNPFLPGLTANLADIHPLAAGGFVVCTSGTSNTVRTYSNSGTLIASATSAVPAPSLGALAATACLEDPEGRIIVAYSGGTDAVRAYSSSSLSTIEWTFTDTNQLTTPAKMSVRSNGNILVLDSGFNHIVEISPDGGLIQRIEPLGIVNPAGIEVIP